MMYKGPFHFGTLQNRPRRWIDMLTVYVFSMSLKFGQYSRHAPILRPLLYTPAHDDAAVSSSRLECRGAQLLLARNSSPDFSEYGCCRA